MLTSINYSAEDKTPQILSDLVTTTVNIAKIAKDLGAGLDSSQTKYPPFTYTFDPFDSAEVSRVVYDLRNREKLELRISPNPSGIRSGIGMAIDSRVAYHERAEDAAGGGVFYHPPTTVEMLLIDHNAQAAADKAKQVKKDENTAVRAAITAMLDQQAREAEKTRLDREFQLKLAAAAATPPVGNGGAKAAPSAAPSAPPSPPPSPPPKNTPPVDKTQPAPVVDKTQPTPKPATLCHVVVTVPDVDEVACLPLGRSFLTKRESNLGFAHGMPTTFVFKQPSGVQAFTGTLSSISGIVAAAVPSLINVKSTSPAAPAPPAAAAVPVGKTEGARAGGKTLTTSNAALGVDQTPGPTDQNYKDTIDQLQGTIGRDSQTLQKWRDLLITELRARHVSDDEINQILVSHGFLRLP